MKIIRNPRMTAALIVAVTAFYSSLLILTPGHIEFERMLNHADTLNSAFWNSWSAFLARGSMKYIGYAYILLAAVIAVFSFTRRRNYDEYQTDVLEKGFLAAGMVMVCLFPLAFLMILSAPNYCIETIILLVTVHWSVVLLTDLFCVIKWHRA